eukprot:1667210-Lingulodinium_polyedra.AAC.1
MLASYPSGNAVRDVAESIMGGIIQHGLDVANAIVARRFRDAAPAARVLEGVVSVTPAPADVSTQPAALLVVVY